VTVTRHAAIGGDKTIHAAEMGGDTGGTREIAAQIQVRKPGRDRRRAAPAASAARASYIPGVIGAAKDFVIGLEIGGDGRRVGLAQDDRSRVAQAGHRRGILLGDIVRQR